MSLPSIFLSYAHADDEPFAKKLYESLTAQGFSVWWDRVSMPNRGPTFTQEIRDSIERADRLLLVAGTGAFSSDYVRYEWMYAYEVGKAINIALRKCDYADLPEELKNYDAPDFREDADYDERLQTLVRQMTEPVAPMGQFHNVPALPPHFLDRPSALDALRDLIIADVNKPTLITAEKRVTAVEGMGGIGKSGLATAFAHDRKVRFVFPDGIVWVIAGRKPSLFELYRAVGIALGDEFGHYPDEPTARQNAQHMLQDKKCLLILDDVWELPVGRAFRDLIHGTPARLLITTRNLQINALLDANEYRLKLIDEAQAVDYLRSWIGYDDPNLETVAQRLGYLFLALKLAGARMKKDGLSGADYLTTFDRVSRMKIDRQSTDREDSLEASIALSVDAAFMDVENEKQFYHTFGVFQEDAAIPQQTILQLWAYLRPNVDPFDLSETLTALIDLALVERHEDKTLTLHDLLHSYTREKLGDRYVQTHQDLLDSYRVDQWRELLPNEPYLWRNIAYHLTEAKQTDTLRALLPDFNWLQAKLDATDANALLGDFAGLTDDEPLRLLESAISMSAHAIKDDKHQFAGQLVGRLIGHSANHPKLASCVEQAKTYESFPTLLPQLPTLTPAGGPLVRTIPLQGTCNAIAFTEDGEHAIVAAFDHINVFELTTGVLLISFTQTQPSHMVTALAVRGEIVVSGDNEGTVKVWHWRDGTLLTGFTQHTDEISAVAVQGDIVVSGDNAGMVKVWRWRDGAPLADFTQHTERINAVAIQEDIVVSGSWDRTVKVGRWADGAPLADFIQHTDKVYAVAMQGDIVVSGSADGTIKAWRWRDGTLLTNFTQHTGAGAIFAVAVQGEIVVSGDGGSIVKVWRWADGELLTNFALHTGVVSAVAVQGDIVISGSCPDNIVKVWRWRNGGRSLTDFKLHGDIVNVIAVQGEIVVSGSYDHTVKVWRWADGTLLTDFTQHTSIVDAVAIQGEFVVSASRRTVKVWRWADGTLLTDFRQHTGEVYAVTVQGEIVVSGSADHTVKVWHWRDGTLLTNFTQHTRGVHAVAVQGKIAVSGSDDGTVKVWRWEDGTLLTDFTQHKDKVYAVTVQGEVVISRSGDGTVKVWRWENGALLTDFKQHAGPVYAVAVQDEIVVFGGSGPHFCGTVEVWRWRDGTLLTDFTQHTRGVTAVTIQGEIAVSGSDDGTVKVWRWGTGEVLAAFTADSLIRSLAIDPDQHVIVAGDFSGHVHVFRPNSALKRIMAGEG